MIIQEVSEKIFAQDSATGAERFDRFDSLGMDRGGFITIHPTEGENQVIFIGDKDKTGKGKTKGEQKAKAKPKPEPKLTEEQEGFIAEIDKKIERYKKSIKRHPDAPGKAKFWKYRWEEFRDAVAKDNMNKKMFDAYSDYLYKSQSPNFPEGWADQAWKHYEQLREARKTEKEREKQINDLQASDLLKKLTKDGKYWVGGKNKRTYINADARDLVEAVGGSVKWHPKKWGVIDGYLDKDGNEFPWSKSKTMKIDNFLRTAFFDHGSGKFVINRTIYTGEEIDDKLREFGIL